MTPFPIIRHIFTLKELYQALDFLKIQQHPCKEPKPSKYDLKLESRRISRNVLALYIQDEPLIYPSFTKIIRISSKSNAQSSMEASVVFERVGGRRAYPKP